MAVSTTLLNDDYFPDAPRSSRTEENRHAKVETIVSFHDN